MPANPLTNILLRIADLNAHHYRDAGELPAMLLIGPRDRNSGFEVLPLEAVTAAPVRRAIADAVLTVTCIEGHMMEQRRDATTGRFPESPNPDSVADNPDSRRCYVYLAQAIDGTRACAVQYILKPEHGRASLAPLKILEGYSVALADPDLADLTRPGTRRATH